MFAKRQFIVVLLTYITFFFCSLIIASLFVLPLNAGLVFSIVSSISIFIITLIAGSKVSDFFLARLQNIESKQGLVFIISDFTKKLQVLYSIDELVFYIQSILELKGDCSVLLVDHQKKYVIYNSPSNITNEEKIFSTLDRNFANYSSEGYFFFDNDFGILSTSKNARGFFLAINEIHLYIFNSSTRFFPLSTFQPLFTEFKKFYNRYKALDEFTYIDELAYEWTLVADTQKAFLPKGLPTIKRLDIAVHYQPLIHVSGDYYTIIELSKTKTLIIVGDVSGKGFSAALIMGIVVNLVKTYANDVDLVELMNIIDRTIKNMKFEDKYTVLFAGIIDTFSMELSYINASMDDIRILTKTPDEYRIKKIPPNCGILGLVDLGKIVVKTIPLFWDDVIFLATDGISEIKNEYGFELGSSPEYLKTIKYSAFNDAKQFITDMNELALSFAGEKKLKDDITMCVIKVIKDDF